MPVERAFAQQFAGRLVVTQTAPPGTIVTEEPTGNAVALDDWRAQITQRRCDSIDQPGIYLDRSVTGAGKSHADIQALRKASHGLVVVPTHENCRELVRDMQRQELSASAYPARIVGEEHEANCWNPDADEAEQMGLDGQGSRPADDASFESQRGHHQSRRHHGPHPRHEVQTS